MVGSLSLTQDFLFFFPVKIRVYEKNQKNGGSPYSIRLGKRTEGILSIPFLQERERERERERWMEEEEEEEEL